MGKKQEHKVGKIHKEHILLNPNWVFQTEFLVNLIPLHTHKHTHRCTQAYTRHLPCLKCYLVLTVPTPRM